MFVKSRSLGTFNKSTHLYSDLLGRLQKGDIDAVAMPVYYPLIDPNETVTYSSAIDEDTMTLCTVYRDVRDSHDGTIFSMLASIPFQLWISYATLFVSFVSIATAGCLVLKLKNWNIFWNTARAFLYQPEFRLRNKFFNCVSILTLISIFILCYATNCMSSDLATLDDPVAITSYDDIIEQDIKVMLFQEMAENDKFANAPIGSKQHALYKRVFKYENTAQSNLMATQMHLEMKSAIIGRQMIAKLMGLAAVNQAAFPADGKVFVAPDESAQKYTNVYAISSKWKGTKLHDILHKR